MVTGAGYLGKLVASLGVDVAGLQTATTSMQKFADNANRQLASVQSQMKKVSSDMKQFGADATRTLTVPLALAGGASANAFKNYELTLAHIEGLTGATKEQTAQWSDELQKMAVNVGKKPQEMAEALYFIASSGVDASKAMNILNVSARASTAGLGSTQQITDLLTSAMNAYAKSGLTASAAADMLTAAVREGKIEASEFASHVGYVIPVAAELGVSFDQVTAAMAAMSGTGAGASTAATQLRQLLSDILKPAMQSEGALKDFGLSGAYLRDVLQKDGLIAALEEVREVTLKHKDAVAKVFPEVRALTGVLQIIGENADHVKEIFKAVAESTGDMQRAFEIVENTLSFQFNKALTQVQLSAISFGEAMKGPLISILTTLSKVLQTITRWFNSLSDSTKTWLLGLTALLAILGPLTYAVGALIGVMNGLVGSFRKIGVFLVANPWVLLAAAIAGAAIALFKFGNSAKAATDEQRKLNDEIERNKALQATAESVAEQMLVINQLNKSQLFGLRTTIELQLSELEKASAESLAKAQAAFDAYWKMQQSQPENTMVFDANGGALITDAKGGADNTKAEKYKLYQKYNLEAASYKDRIALFDNFTKTIDARIKALPNAENNSTSKQADAIADILQKFATGQATIISQEYLMGTAFDDSEAMLSLYSSTIKDLLDNGLTPLSPEVVKLALGWEDLNYSVLAADQMIKEATDALDNLSPSVLGITNDIRESSKEMRDFISVMKEIGDIKIKNNIIADAFGDSIGKTKQYELALNSIHEQIRSVDDALMEAASGGVEINKQAIQDLVNKLIILNEEQARTEMNAARLSTIYGGVTDAVVQLTADLGNMVVESKHGWWSMVDTILKGAQQIINSLLAMAVAAMIAKEVGSKGIIGLAVAAVGVAALMAMWNGYKNKIQENGKKDAEAAKMANGGIVPPGYANDTYPALLSSGEVIVPPGKFENIQGGGNITVSIVHDTLTSKEIKYRVKDAERREKSMY